MSKLTCCFCFGLKGGSIASAVFALVANVKALIGCIVAAVLFSQTADYEVEEFPERFVSEDPTVFDEGPRTITLHNEYWYFPVIMFSSLAGLFAVAAVFSVLLLIGIQKVQKVQKDVKAYFLPWLIIMGIEVGGCVILACLIVLLHFGSHDGLMAVGVLLLGAFGSYTIWCVTAYYKSLSAATEVSSQNREEAKDDAQLVIQEEIPYKMEKDSKPLV